MSAMITDHFFEDVSVSPDRFINISHFKLVMSMAEGTNTINSLSKRGVKSKKILTTRVTDGVQYTSYMKHISLNESLLMAKHIVENVEASNIADFKEKWKIKLTQLTNLFILNKNYDSVLPDTTDTVVFERPLLKIADIKNREKRIEAKRASQKAFCKRFKKIWL